jgi:hypothetical protein
MYVVAVSLRRRPLIPASKFVDLQFKLEGGEKKKSEKRLNFTVTARG